MQETSYFHVFFDKDHLSFYVPRKKIFSRKRNAFFPDEARNIIFHAIFLERTPLQNIWRKYHIFMFFFKERSSFIFRPKNKIIFSERRSINFPDDTRKIIFQCNLFGNAIYISLSSLFMNISTGLVLQYNYCYQYTFCCLIKNVKNH